MTATKNNTFLAKVKKYLGEVNQTQSSLAIALNRNASDLNRQLTGKSKMTEQTAADVIEELAKRGAFTYRQEVEELLLLKNYLQSSLIKWDLPPFSKLKSNAPASLDEVQLPLNTGSAATLFPIPKLTLPNSYPANLNLNSSTGIRLGDGSFPNLPLAHLARRPLPVPPPAPEFFGGRDDELAELKNQLKGEEVISLTAVKGLGGIGKTTIAQKLASDLYRNPEEKYFAAVLWVEIKREPKPLELLTDWALMADPTFIYRNQSPDKLVNPVKALMNQYVTESYGSGKLERVLVVFDDVWDDGLETVKLLRNASPDDATILITTRSGKVAQFLSKKVVQLDKLEPEKGVLLLKEYLPAAAENDLYELAVVLDGHALAMTLAARRLLLETEFNRAELLQTHIEEYQRSLPEGTPFATLQLEQGEDKEENLTKALFYSYDELSRQEQRLFRALGTLPYNAPFNEEMLFSIWGVSREKAHQTCQRLRLLSLIDEDKKASREYKGVWYRQHPLVQAYALALLKNPKPSTS